jgi:hypothetical protein
MYKANRMYRPPMFSLFAAVAFISILVFSPPTSAKAAAGSMFELQTPRQDESATIGVRKHRIPSRVVKNVLIPDEPGLFESSLVQSPSSPDVSPNIVVSQVYGGGGASASSLFSNDFIELFNRGNSPVSVNGWSVQYTTAAATTWTQLTALPNVTIQPGKYLLIQGTTSGAGGDPLPTADVIGSMALDTTSGKVALVSNTTTLTGGCPVGGGIVDFLGYGSAATCYEGPLPASGPSVSNAAKRLSAGCTDNDVNRYDFAPSAALPRNSASPANVCTGPTIGGRIAFTSNRSGSNTADTDVFIMNADGSSQTRLTNDPTQEQYPTFSPDGTKILFTRGGKVYVMNVDGSSQTELTATTQNSAPRFSPNASKIVFSSTRDGQSEIYIMDANGSNQTRLTTDLATDVYPVFSPDGTKIAFASDRDGWFEIYIMNVNGSNPVRLTNVTNRDSSAPVFSPDGTKIAFESDRASGTSVNIWIMNVDGTGATRLTTAVDDFAASFSPDGSAIVFYTTRHGGDNWEIYTMNLDGSNQRNVSSTLGTDLEPSWGVVAGNLAVTNVDSPGGSGAFGVGAIIPITVTFGAPVTVTGTPTLRLATGGAGTAVNYSTGSGTSVLTFNYTVAAGHASSDLDYTSATALVLNGGTINSFGGTPATLALPAPGASGSLGANRNIVIDTIAPDTTINTGPSGSVSSTSASFTFTSTEAGTFQCSLDGAAFASCVSGTSYTSLGQGSHTFLVRASDVAQNQDATPASRTWTVDTVAPDTTIDSGPSGNVSSSSATFTFSSNEAGVGFECSLNSAAFASCTSPTTYNSLAEGARTFAVRAADAAGNLDATPASRNWTVDTVAPDTTINSGPSGAVASTIANFTFSSNEGTATFQCSLDGAGFSTCASPAIYGGLSQGAHTFAVRAVDLANNTDATPATRNWTADTIAPDTTIDSGPVQNSTVSSTTATFTFSSNEASVTFLCSINGGLYSPCTSPAVYNGLAQGARTFGVRAVDAAGNQDGSPATRSWTINSNLSISGNVKQAPTLTNLAGVTITLSGCGNAVTSTDGSGNYNFNGLFSGTCTITPSGLGKFYDSISRTYANISGNITGADFLAYDTMAAAPRKLRTINPYVVPGQNVVLSVILDSQGNETSVAFSINYDQTMFVGQPVVACGSGAGAGCGLTVVPGSIGITVVPQAGTFAAGAREVVTVTFQTQPTLASNTLMDLTTAPTALLIKNSSNDSLLAELVDGLIVYQQGLEGDLGGRPTGDGVVFSNDVIFARQFAAGTATPNAAYNEFQRVDSAPSATKGDGLITSGDVIQARRYASGTSTPTGAGGPFQAVGQGSLAANLAAADTDRSVRVTPRTAVAGQKVTVPVEMKAVGNELAARFTLEYDSMKLSKPVVLLSGVAPSDAVLTINDKVDGRLTVLVDSETAFLATDGPLVNVTFDVSPTASAGETRIAFADNGSIANAMADELSAAYMPAYLTINGAGSPEVGIGGRVLTSGGRGLGNASVTIAGPDGYLRTVVTSTLGYYSFDGVPAGAVYTVGVRSKRYRFEVRTVELSSELANLDFVGLE